MTGGEEHQKSAQLAAVPLLSWVSAREQGACPAHVGLLLFRPGHCTLICVHFVVRLKFC